MGAYPVALDKLCFFQVMCQSHGGPLQESDLSPNFFLLAFASSLLGFLVALPLFSSHSCPSGDCTGIAHVAAREALPDSYSKV
ncbi:hypothetical protein NL676_023400 [Syzygium grande]|nr:hypothetical protein NL676_023400 [Syzygium grande]